MYLILLLCNQIDHTSITESDKYEINVYPNPTSSFVTIGWEGDVQQIELTDVRGRKLEMKDTKGDNSSILDLSKLFKRCILHPFLN